LSKPLTVTTMAGSFYELSAKDIDGKTVCFDKFKGKVPKDE
jgi:glutathione peroxidase-family protein